MHLTEQESQIKDSFVAIESNAAGAPGLREIEQIDDRIRKARELAKSCNYFPAWEIIGLGKAYLRGELNMGLMRRVFDDKANCGFVWSCSRTRPTTMNRDECVESVPRSRNDKNPWSSRIDGKQPCMLSQNVEVMESAERIVTCLSFVRFQRFDDSSFLGGKGLYEFVPFESLTGYKDCSARSDREVGIIFKSLAVAVSKRVRENIQAASDRIQVDTSLDLERERERLFFFGHYHIIRNIRWLVSDRQANIIVEPSIKPFLKGWEIGFGPIDRSLSVL